MDSLSATLARAGAEALASEIGPDRLGRVAAMLDSKLWTRIRSDPGALARVLLALSGESALEDERLRRLLFALLPADLLAEWSSRWAKRAFDKPADNVFALAAVPWRAGSSLALELANALGIPSEYLPRANPVEPALSIVVPFSPLPPLRDYQQEVKDAVVTALQATPARVLVQMPTGAGKTRTAMDAVVAVAKGGTLFAKGRSVLWLAHVDELCDQAVTAFEEAWWNSGAGPAALVRCFGRGRPNVGDYEGAFIVATYQRLAALQKTSGGEFRRIAEPVDLVVADEAHKVIAPTFLGVLEDQVLERASLIGLTATPGRGLEAQRENSELAAFFWKNLVGPSLGENPIRELRARGVLAAVKHRAIESGVELSLTPSEREGSEWDLPSSVLARLAESGERNRKILQAILEEVGLARSCLVFACSVEHSRLLAAALTLRGISAAHIDSTISERVRASLVQRFKTGGLSVLLNFGVLSTGFDAPRVASVVIARPTTSVVLYSQMIGRGLRGPASGGNAECTLIDVRDNFEAFGAVDQVYSAFADYWVS